MWDAARSWLGHGYNVDTKVGTGNVLNCAFLLLRVMGIVLVDLSTLLKTLSGFSRFLHFSRFFKHFHSALHRVVFYELWGSCWGHVGIILESCWGRVDIIL